MKSTSVVDTSSLNPAEKPSSVHAPGIGYIMIESGRPGGGHFVRCVVLEHVVLDGLLVPVVRRAAEVGDHGRLVPLDAALGILVLVDQAERVPELVQHHPPNLGVGLSRREPAVVHRRLRLRNAAALSAQVRPGSVPLLEGDPHVCRRRVDELQSEVGHSRSGPSLRYVPNALLQRLVTF